VHKASFYDPEINRSYGAMAAHHGVGILPARPYHPKDKAKVEAGVRMGRLRNMRFLSLAECNAAITEILVQLNGRVMRRLGVSRRVRRVMVGAFSSVAADEPTPHFAATLRGDRHEQRQAGEPARCALFGQASVSEAPSLHESASALP
jgi:hypothetical protein